ncbi:MAG: tyrosine-type recombinase/integrase [Candidatus Bathyarchaeia archaeon]
MDQGSDGASVKQPEIGRGFSGPLDTESDSSIIHKPQASLPLPLPVPISLPTSILCPECGSSKAWKDGRRLTDRGFVQRWLCRKCGYRFSLMDKEVSSKKDEKEKGKEEEKPLAKAPEPFLRTDPFESIRAEASIPSLGKGLNSSGIDSKDRQVCVPEGGSKNLAAPIASEKQGAGATGKLGLAEFEGKILEFLWWMKKNGYKESTIEGRGQRLRRLVKLGADLMNPEIVKEVIARQGNWSESRKEAMVYAYDLFAKWIGIKWERPIYKPARKLPFIPLEREIDDLIAGCNKYIGTFLQIAKETGARSGEIFNLKWADVDFESRTLRITAEKGSDPRIFKISNRLISMLNQLPIESERIFRHYKNLQNLRRSFERYRKRMAHKLGNPRILQIHFHTLRHWKGTMEYHKTKDILHVMNVLGHKEIKNTLLYTQLVKFEGEDEYICKVARKPDEIQGLIEAGFEYILQKDGLAYFRKRK